MGTDQLKRAKECYADLKETWRANHRRMLEDLRFSNPVDPQQWDDAALTARKDRVCLTLDRTNQYIVQVVNGARMNKPGINVMPVDSRADVDAASALDGIVRHIEYRSRAQIAYDWAIEGAARCGVGWLRVVPRTIDAETNTQEICIERVVDHLAAIIDGEQPDGSDAMNGFVESLVPKRRFEREYPKSSTQSWESDRADGWMHGEFVRVCEYQYIDENKAERLVVAGPDGAELTLSDDEYRELVARVGFEPPVTRRFVAKLRKVKWLKFNGVEVLEETELPGQWIGLVPVIGFEAIVEGERSLCGLTRRLIDSQRAYNYERSAMVETVALQPKAPVMVPVESAEGHEEHWKALNKGQPAYLPYNALDVEGRQLPRPERLAPPMFPAAFAQGGQIAISDMEASVGMYQANLGQPNNATSGKQERERKQQGAVATFHFADNQARSIEHVGRIVVGMIPTIYDTRRQAKIIGVDGQQSDVMIDPGMPEPARKRGSKVVAINPGVGSYDVRVRTGPSYATQREEAAEGITAILQAAPNFAPVLAPELARMRDWPNAERIARALTAVAPPPVQAILQEGDGDEEPISPKAQAQLQQMQEQGAQMARMLDAAEAELQRLQAENERLQLERLNKQNEIEARLQEAEIQSAADVQEATIRAQAQIEAAQIAHAAQAQAAEAESSALAAITPTLSEMQQQLAALAAREASDAQRTSERAGLAELVHERDPVTGLLVGSYDPTTGRYVVHERDPQTRAVVRSVETTRAMDVGA